MEHLKTAVAKVIWEQKKKSFRNSQLVKRYSNGHSFCKIDFA